MLKTDTLASLGIEIIFAHHDSSACGLHRVWGKIFDRSLHAHKSVNRPITKYNFVVFQKLGNSRVHLGQLTRGE